MVRETLNESDSQSNKRGDLPLWVTFFADKGARRCGEEELTFDELHERIIASRADAKDWLPWLKLAQFGGKRTDKDSLRHDANVLSISGIEADYDGERVSFEDAVAKLEVAGISALLYTSPSHTPDKPRWRVLCDTSRELKPGRRYELVERLNGILGGILTTESFTLSQAYYYGAVGDNPPPEVAIVEGDYIDLRDDLPRIGKPGRKANGSNGHAKLDEDELIAAIIHGDSYHTSSMQLIGAWVRKGWSEAKIRERLESIFEEISKADRDRRWQDRVDDIERSIADIFRKDAAAHWDAEAGAPRFSEEALALHFAERHEPTLRHVAAWGKWIEWNGVTWKNDETLTAFHHARAICREAAGQCGESPTQAKALASSKTAGAVERLARADRRLAATIDQWDADLGMINDHAGAIDIATGAKARPHRREDYCTKVAGTGADWNRRIPLWTRFLDRITAGDQELQAYLQRFCGYCCTGYTTEHVMGFAYGTGANGKTTFINTISGCLGDYAAVAPMEMFIATKNDRHPTELARLRGARLVVASEVDEGAVWSEAKIKQLTGGDKVAARFMRQEFFEYTPQFKLFVVGNHRPRLRNVDVAWRRRMHLIPFTVTIPKKERDQDLGEKLKAEWPGIFAWMLDGAVAWQKSGLQPPKAVLDATEGYLESEDKIGRWIEERCITGPDVANEETRSSELFTSWKEWAERNGEFVGSNTLLSTKLEERGYKKRHTKLGALFAGITVIRLREGGARW
jgi:putative DNA primase/helicase